MCVGSKVDFCKCVGDSFKVCNDAEIIVFTVHRVGNEEPQAFAPPCWGYSGPSWEALTKKVVSGFIALATKSTGYWEVSKKTSWLQRSKIRAVVNSETENAGREGARKTKIWWYVEVRVTKFQKTGRRWTIKGSNEFFEHVLSSLFEDIFGKTRDRNWPLAL